MLNKRTMTPHITKIAEKTIKVTNIKWNEETKKICLRKRETYNKISLAYKINEEIIRILENKV